MPFIECRECSEKLGSPILCDGCLHNRQTINRLERSMAQMREDFRRIQMMAEQHCPADASIKEG